MLLEAGQAISHAAGSGAYITGTFVVDGAILIATLKAVEIAISKVRRHAPNVNGKSTKPGESVTCKLHGEDLATLKEFKTNAAASLLRIETKVDRLLERGK